MFPCNLDEVKHAVHQFYIFNFEMLRYMYDLPSSPSSLSSVSPSSSLPSSSEQTDQINEESNQNKFTFCFAVDISFLSEKFKLTIIYTGSL